MGLKITAIRLKIETAEKYPRVRDLASLLSAVESLYTLLTPRVIGRYDRAGKVSRLPNAYRLYVQSVHSGNSIHLSLLGMDRALDALRRILETIRDWGQRKEQAREKTLQERERTQAMKIENIKGALALIPELRVLSTEEQKRVLDLAGRIARNPNRILNE